jgi:Arylsulfotransferase (ASST)
LSAKLSRRRLLKAMGAAWVALIAAPGCEPDPRNRATGTPAQQGALTFRSRPDLQPPTVEVVTRAHDTAPGYVFAAPKTSPRYRGTIQNGPMIVDNRGELVWFRPMRGEGVRAMDFKVQRYRGEPVLTYYQGVGTTYGRGEYVILDGSYREVARVRAGNGYLGDHHEFLITERDTALITIYDPVPWDLSPVGGSTDGVALDGIAQEVDIGTGEVLLEWHSLEHVGVDESFSAPENPEGPFDYFHINSIDVDHDSNLLVSARRTFAVYKIDRETGEVIWRLGGKKSDFEMGPGTLTRFQHDARRQADGTITVFDNGGVHKDDRSYGVVLDVDETAVTVERRYGHPDERVAAVMGSMQVLPNDNVFIGWGSDPLFSEFGGDGELLFHASFPPKVDSYRAFRSPWTGHPEEEPAVAAERGSDGEVTLYASWNGATGVAAWQALAGPGPQRLEPVGSAPREGFETAITVRTTEPYVGVRAEDRSGRVLGTSGAIEPDSQ